MSAKQNLWDELLERRIFTDEDHPACKHVWWCVERLMENKRITQGDVIVLMSLIDHATDYRDE
jgi:hypothetical protein